MQHTHELQTYHSITNIYSVPELPLVHGSCFGLGDEWQMHAEFVFGHTNNRVYACPPASHRLEYRGNPS
eukprot:6179524-Pleurochrysis_carterae.AAC.4